MVKWRDGPKLSPPVRTEPLSEKIKKKKFTKSKTLIGQKRVFGVFVASDNRGVHTTGVSIFASFIFFFVFLPCTRLFDYITFRGGNIQSSNKDQFPKIEVKHRDEADSRTLIGLLQWLPFLSMPCLFFFSKFANVMNGILVPLCAVFDTILIMLY